MENHGKIMEFDSGKVLGTLHLQNKVILFVSYQNNFFWNETSPPAFFW